VDDRRGTTVEEAETLEDLTTPVLEHLQVDHFEPLYVPVRHPKKTTCTYELSKENFVYIILPYLKIVGTYQLSKEDFVHTNHPKKYMHLLGIQRKICTYQPSNEYVKVFCKRRVIFVDKGQKYLFFYQHPTIKKPLPFA